MKKILFLFFSLLVSIDAMESYQTYSYLDKHKVKTVMQDSVSNQFLEINGTLHIRYIEDNKTEFLMFWLENGIRDKEKLDIDSIYIPFIVQNRGDGFYIKDLQSISMDTNLNKRLMGIVDIMQFNGSKGGLYSFPNALGALETNETKVGDKYKMEYQKQYTKKSLREDVKYYDSYGEIVADNNSSIWHTILAKQTIKFKVKMMRATIRDFREFNLTQNEEKLNKNHWFFNLPLDISKWDFQKSSTKNRLSSNSAIKIFDKKIDELQKLIDNDKNIESWVRENMDMLRFLSEILENKSLNDIVSQKLFAKLGYIDNPQSVQILSEVSLNENIKSIERFRGMMGLKNTSAPIDDELLDDILSYGLNSQGGGDDIQRSLGMLSGALAANRVDRVPTQYETISDAITDAVNSSTDKVVALNAAGNMHQTAPDRVVKSVEKLLSSTDDTYSRRRGAEALLKINRTDLTFSEIKEMAISESNTDTTAQLIRATAITNPSTAKENEINGFLINMATSTNKKVKSNRLSALETLDKIGFGKTKDEKQIIRNLMLSERDSDVQKILRDIYRREK